MAGHTIRLVIVGPRRHCCDDEAKRHGTDIVELKMRIGRDVDTLVSANSQNLLNVAKLSPHLSLVDEEIPNLLIGLMGYRSRRNVGG